jgi:hypothetical protein
VDEAMEDDVRVTVIATDFQDGWQGQNPATTTRTTQTTTTTKDGKIPGFFGNTTNTTPAPSTPSKKTSPSGYDIPSFFKKN